MRPKFTFGTIFAASLLLQSGVVVAAPPPVESAQVMLVGMFHFANPGRDMVKSRVINVMTPSNQTYLDGLSARIAEFRPTDVLVECSPADQSQYDRKFRDYVDGRFELPSNETYQIGFRVAKVAGLSGGTGASASATACDGRFSRSFSDRASRVAIGMSG